MLVRTRASAARQTAAPQQTHRTVSFPPPVVGLVTDENLATDLPGAARVLENWFPTNIGVRMRGGVSRHALAGTGIIRSIIEHRGRISEKGFAVSNGILYDVTAPATPTTPLTPVSGIPARTNDKHHFANISTVGNDYTIAVNGMDKAIIYNGSTWDILDNATARIDFDAQTANYTVGSTVTGGTSGATAIIVSVIDNGTTGTIRARNITGTFVDNEIIAGGGGSATANIPTGITLIPGITGVDTAKFSHVWVHGSRVWFAEKDSKTAWYLPVDSVGGAASDFSLAGVFQDGGALYAGGSWSQDSGSGSSDRIVFQSTNGELSVYGGTDPASAANWQIFGNYRSSPPVSRKMIKVGGDLLVANVDGIVPMSSVVSKDVAALRLSAITRRIETEWKNATSKLTSGQEVEILKWTEKNMLLASFPGPTLSTTSNPVWGVAPHTWGSGLIIWGGGALEYSSGTGDVFAANIESGSWTRFVGFDAHCFGKIGGRGFFGGQYGGVFEMEKGGSDDGRAIYYRYLAWPSSLESGSAYKMIGMCSSTFIASHDFNINISANVDYDLILPVPPGAAIVNTSSDVYDVGRYDEAIYDASYPKQTVRKWRAIGRSGVKIAISALSAHSSQVLPDVEMIQQEVTYEAGKVIV